ncbi:MAG: TIGR03960 family B12-binding radical SAM protein [Chloroflexi bacterium]|nr:TIGR03960 family B12-binding radical SAM protein [Chloroflexota bacterium]
MVDIDSLLSRVNKPARYTGGEWNSVSKDWRAARVRLALAYPDIYEVGMSNLGLSILYDAINSRPDFLAERVYAPWVDLEEELRNNQTPLFSLESRRPLRDFDVLGFSLGCELTYTNLLNMLELGGVPLLAAERGDDVPLVIAGGTGAYNPEPLADFVDLFVVGDGEAALPELLALFAEFSVRRAGDGPRFDRRAFLRRAAQLGGVYVPSLYAVRYGDDGTVEAVEPAVREAPATVLRRLVRPLPPSTTRPLVPTLNTVHDRGAVEVMRGCPNGCRFCQAGQVYLPVRLRPADEVLAAVDELLACTGYEELSLLSLSTGDYPGVAELLRDLAARYPDTNFSLPSLRVDSFSVELANSLRRRKTSLTFAPEAGSQRLRDVINKRVTEEDLLRAAAAAYGAGWSTVKLYFMVGLPTETPEDVAGIGRLSRTVLDVGRRAAGRRAQLHVSVSTFVPKPHTPFQWAAQDNSEVLAAKHSALRAAMPRAVSLSWNDPRSSLLEAALSRGDRRLGATILRARQLGCRFDAWSEHQRFDLWQQAAQETGRELAFYGQRERSLEEVLPWGHIRSGASPEHLRRQWLRALGGAAEGSP